MLIPTADNSGILIPKNSSINNVADLKGKNVAVVGVNTGGDIPMLQAAAAAGIDPKSITEIAVPYAGMQAALEQGTVDAAFAADTYYHQLVDAGFKSIASPVREFQGNMPVTVWAATDAWLKSNPGTAKKFNDAMTKAATFYTDPANVKAIVDITARIKQVDAVQGQSQVVRSGEHFHQPGHRPGRHRCDEGPRVRQQAVDCRSHALG